MSNSYYNHGSYPTTGAPGTSASMRSELSSISAGFDLLPVISGNGNKAVIVNSGATSLSVTTGGLALAGDFTTTGAYNTTLIQGATTSLTLPLVSGTLATLAGTEEFTNKTLTSAVAKGTWTTSGTWTLPALTLGGAITYGGVTLSNAVTGTGNMVLSASPTLTGTIAAASQTLSGTLGVTGVATFTAQPILSSLTASKPVFTDASKGLTSTGTLAYDQGGTGLTSYTAGDIIYASGANTVAKLPIGTTGQRLVVAAGLPSWATDTTIGTVTSVGWTGGIVSVATATTTPAFTIAGTSGGIPYFASGTTWATSAALAANALVLGGGAGAAPATTTTGTGVVTALGVNTGTAGAFVVNGGALGSPSSAGTIPAFTLGGTVAGGGNQINNVIIGTTTPLAGAFTTLSASSTATLSGLTASTALALDASKNIVSVTNTGSGNNVLATSPTITGATLTTSAFNGTVGATTPSTGAFTTLSATGNISTTGSSSVLQVLAGASVQIQNAAATANWNLATSGMGLSINSPQAGTLSISNNTAVTGTLSSTLDATHYGVTVGRGGGAVSTNTAVGASALAATATGGFNTALGSQSLYSNTTASNNTAVGYQAGFTNSAGTQNVFIGRTSGYLSTSNYNTFIGDTSGYNTTGQLNTFLGWGAGYLVTSGSKNTILGGYGGNSGGLDIRTANNYVVLSDGDGNIVASTKSGQTFALQGGTLSAGTGITFPATQSASTDANTLDDYEEGTWTPTIYFGGASVGVTYTTQTGTYTKVGNIVRLTANITLSNKGSSTTYAEVRGIPFAAPTILGNGAGVVPYYASMLGLTGTMTVDVYQSTISLRIFGAVQPASVQDTNFTNTSTITFTCTYYV